MQKLPNVLGIIPDIVPSTYMHTIKPLRNLQCKGEIKAKVLFESQVNEISLDWADIVLFNRNIHWLLSDWVTFLRENHKPYIYDLDDNFFEIPAETDFGRELRHPARLNNLKCTLRQAGLVRVYSTLLGQEVSQYNEKYHLVRGPVDWSLIAQGGNLGKRVRIVYATSRVIDDSLGAVFVDAIELLLNKYPEKVEFHFWGSHPFKNRSYFDCRFHPFTWDYDRYISSFSRTNHDIGLAPLLDDKFHLSKTEVKYREYGACGVAGIYSDVDVYSNHVSNMENGLLVNNDTKSWFDAMSLLVENEGLRNNIKQQASKDVRERYSQTDFDKILLEDIHVVLAQPVTNQKMVFNVIFDGAGKNHEQNSGWKYYLRKFKNQSIDESIQLLICYLKRLCKIIWLRHKLYRTCRL